MIRRKMILVIVLMFLFESIFPVSQRGLKWENMNCWMISVLSALINTKPLYEILKDYNVEILASDSPDRKIRKEILQEFIKIMNQSFEAGESPIITSHFYNKIYDAKHDGIRSYDFNKGSFWFADYFLKGFLGDIVLACPKLQEIFFISKEDSVYMKECYNKDFLLHRMYKKNELDNFVILVSGSEWPLDLTTSIFNKDQLRKGKSINFGRTPEICVKAKCGQNDDYVQKGFVAFKKAPRIIIFQNSVPMKGFGIKFPYTFKIPEKFFTDQKRVTFNKYNLYSVIMTSPGSHFWNYSRNTSSDKWIEYNYSDIKECLNGKIENIMSTGFDESKNKVPNYIFYEMENYEQYSFKIKLIDLHDNLSILKSKLLELKSKLELLKNKISDKA